jgi:hypothetical protein
LPESDVFGVETAGIPEVVDVPVPIYPQLSEPVDLVYEIATNEDEDAVIITLVGGLGFVFAEVD